MCGCRAMKVLWCRETGSPGRAAEEVRRSSLLVKGAVGVQAMGMDEPNENLRVRTKEVAVGDTVVSVSCGCLTRRNKWVKLSTDS